MYAHYKSPHLIYLESSTPEPTHVAKREKKKKKVVKLQSKHYLSVRAKPPFFKMTPDRIAPMLNIGTVVLLVQVYDAGISTDKIYVSP